MTLREVSGALEGRAVIGDAEALTLRQAIYGSTLTVTRKEVEDFFRFDAEAHELSPAWRQLFVESATDLVVRRSQTAGYVDQDTAYGSRPDNVRQREGGGQMLCD